MLTKGCLTSRLRYDVLFQILPCSSISSPVISPPPFHNHLIQLLSAANFKAEQIDIIIAFSVMISYLHATIKVTEVLCASDKLYTIIMLLYVSCNPSNTE